MPNFWLKMPPKLAWHCARKCSVRTPVQVARKPRQNKPRLRKEDPSSMASSSPPTGAANAVETPEQAIPLTQQPFSQAASPQIKNAMFL